jgi:hypothetical protein
MSYGADFTEQSRLAGAYVGRVIIPGHAKVARRTDRGSHLPAPQRGWDLDAFDSTPVLIHDVPRPHEMGAMDRLRHRSARQRSMQGSRSKGGRCTGRIVRKQLVRRLATILS